MTRRPTLLLTLTASTVLPLLIGGCGGTSTPARTSQDDPALAALPPEEQFFVGRWRVNMDRMVAQVKSRGKVGDAGMAIGIADTFFFDIDADHTFMWSGGRTAEPWALRNGRIVLQQGASGRGLTLSKCGDAACVDGGTGEPPIELQRVAPGTPLNPVDVAGTWTLDVDASVKASLAEFERTAKFVEDLSGKPLGDNAPTEQHARASIQNLIKQGGDSLVFTPGAAPGEGTVQSGSKPRGGPMGYRVYKDLVLVKSSSGGPDNALILPVTITDGALLWKVSGSAMVYRRK